MGSFASPAFPHRRPASAALAQIRAAAIPVATATALLSLYGAGLRVVALLGLPLLAAAFGARPLPRGPRAALSTLTGVLGLGGGLIARNPLLVAAAIVFLAAGLGSAWGVNRGRRRRRAWAYRSLTALASILVALILVYPWLIAIDYLAKPREAIDAQALGLPHRDVSFVASDGVRLAGWYAPGRNGAAIVLVHGGGGDREGTIRHARLLARAGYGVLLYDARGRGESGGHENAFGWRWDRDVRGAVDYLERSGVRHVGLLGLSTGAEAVVTEAATDPRVAAVVADGLQGRTPGDASHLAFGNRISIEPAFAVVAATIRIVRGEHQPPPMIDLVHRVAERRPLLLIGTEGFEREIDRAYVRGSQARLWELPSTAHTKGLATHPRAYDQRVVGLFDHALLASS
jgi:uncharacterized protein